MSGDAAGAERTQTLLSAVRGLFDGHALPAAAKALLSERGFEPSYVRRGLMAWKKAKAKARSAAPAKAA